MVVCSDYMVLKKKSFFCILLICMYANVFISIIVNMQNMYTFFYEAHTYYQKRILVTTPPKKSRENSKYLRCFCHVDAHTTRTTNWIHITNIGHKSPLVIGRITRRKKFKIIFISQKVILRNSIFIYLFSSDIEY